MRKIFYSWILFEKKIDEIASFRLFPVRFLNDICLEKKAIWSRWQVIVALDTSYWLPNAQRLGQVLLIQLVVTMKAGQ